jgi:HK97 family phage portal protein
MSLYSRFRNYLFKQANQYLQVAFMRWETQQGRQPRNSQELLDNYLSWVYACASRNATAVAEQPLKLYRKVKGGAFSKSYAAQALTRERKGVITKSAYVTRAMAAADDIEEILEHPFLDLLKNVNPVNNEFDTKELLVLHQELCGNAYMYIIMGALGMPQELWLLPPQHITIKPDSKRYYGAFIYAKGTQQETTFKPEEIVHFKYPNPKDILYGLSPLQAAAHSVDLNKSMLEHENALFENRAMPETAIVYPAGVPVNKETGDLIKEQFRVEYGGVKNAGKVAVLGSGATIQPLTLSPKELNYLESRKFNRDEIAAIFGIPKSKLETDDVNRANAEAGNYTYAKDTILPRLMRIQDKLNERILPLYDETLFVAFDNPVPEDREFRLKERVANIQVGYTTVNEERAVDGLEPHADGDELRTPGNLFGDGGFGDGGSNSNNGGNGGGDDSDGGKGIAHLIEKTVEATLKKKEMKRLNASGNASSPDKIRKSADSQVD